MWTAASGVENFSRKFFTTPAEKNQNLFCQPATTSRLAG
ncbi:hypothetical protein D083_0066 [Dickeya solani RNS 08.23.3.1.A]|nr:hypothetical protein D083_0066 [Dickeya solani RNS 08.23.3.1.A]